MILIKPDTAEFHNVEFTNLGQADRAAISVGMKATIKSCSVHRLAAPGIRLKADWRSVLTLAQSVVYNQAPQPTPF